ncbi:MAG: nucleotidyltransferase [Gemmatimonadota bacterium]
MTAQPPGGREARAPDQRGLFATVGRLVDAKIRFVVIGGVAAVAQGAVWVTQDVDICYDSSEDNREKLAALLASLNGYPRGIEPGLPFIMDARTLRDHEVLTLSTDAGDLDLLRLVAGVGDHEDCLARSEEVEVDGVAFRVLSLPALIDAKRASGRPRDIDHLRILEVMLEERSPPP